MRTPSRGVRRPGSSLVMIALRSRAAQLSLPAAGAATPPSGAGKGKGKTKGKGKGPTLSPEEKAKLPCRFGPKREWRKKGTCHYSHEDSPPALAAGKGGNKGGNGPAATAGAPAPATGGQGAETGVCFKFAHTGECRSGPSCKYSHDPAACAEFRKSKEDKVGMELLATQQKLVAAVAGSAPSPAPAPKATAAAGGAPDAAGNLPGWQTAPVEKKAKQAAKKALKSAGLATALDPSAGTPALAQSAAF